MKTTEVKNKFYHFNQNNSGGYFVEDDKFGICEDVIIQASSPKHAYTRLNEIGDNVPGMFSSCSCCGDRWSDWMDESDGKDVPMIYDTPVENIKKGMFRSRAFVHYLDGSFKEFKF